MKRIHRHIALLLLLVVLVVTAGCSTTRHVPQGEYLLRKVTVKTDGTIPPAELKNYLRQRLNSRSLGLFPFRLYTYNWSGIDSTRRANRWLRRIGEAPVVFSPSLTAASQRQLRQAAVNRGYLHADVIVDTTVHGRKIDVKYTVVPHRGYIIDSLRIVAPDTAIERIIRHDVANRLVSPGSPLDRTVLDAERTRLTDLLRQSGYYAFTRDYITYTADTLSGSPQTHVTLHIANPKGSDRHMKYMVRRVIFAANENISDDCDTTAYRDIFYTHGADGNDPFIKPSIMWQNNFIEPDEPYNARQVDRTYEALARLGIVKSVNITMTPTATPGEMDAVVIMQKNKLQGVAVELEGTNSEGDLGVGASVTYRHRNIFHGSELLTVKGRGSYESISGNLEGLINNHYTEGAGEVSLTLPRFEMPFIKRDYRRKVLASTELSLSGSYQERPEYTRVISSAAVRYKWNNRNGTNRRTFDLLDLSYVFLPRSTINFLDDVSQGNPMLRYSYEDHLIMRMGFSIFLTNRPPQASTATHRPIWTLRANAESAGNLLYAISAMVGQHKEDGAYKIFGTQYAQYVKGEADWAVRRAFSRRFSLAFRAGAGVAVPYGNSQMVPFEKRFYAGGANSVRGWNVRTLGPGRYDSRNSVTGFINQCGDIRLDINLEARCKLFWVVEGALFIDGGNVWTIRNYESQPNGEFHFNTFYRELAWAYGAGIRLDFTYFLLRFDLGLKAYNPAIGQEPWPLTHPDWRRDATLHFSVGYPF